MSIYTPVNNRPPFFFLPQVELRVLRSTSTTATSPALLPPTTGGGGSGRDGRDGATSPPPPSSSFASPNPLDWYEGVALPCIYSKQRGPVFAASCHTQVRGWGGYPWVLWLRSRMCVRVI